MCVCACVCVLAYVRLHHWLVYFLSQQTAYSRMRMDSASGVVDWACVDATFGRFVAPTALKRLFGCWDKAKVGVAQVDAILVTLATCCNGSIEEKAKLAFTLFDPTTIGVLNAAAVCNHSYLIAVCCSMWE